MGEYPYNYKRLVPDAFRDYVSFSVPKAKPEQVMLSVLSAVETYLRDSKFAGLNMIVDWCPEDNEINLFNDYFKLEGIPCYAYDKSSVPKDCNLISENILAPSVDIDTNEKCRVEIRWCWRSISIGWAKDKFKKKYVIGVDASIINKTDIDRLFGIIDEILIANTDVKIFLCNTNYRHPSFLERYGNRLYYREKTSDPTEMSSLCIEAAILSRCSSFIGDRSFFSSFVRSYSGKQLDSVIVESRDDAQQV